MTWQEISVRVSRPNASLVENLLQNEDVLALTLTDDADDPVLEPGVGETPLWPSVCVTALFDGNTDIEPLTRMLSLVPGVDWPHQVTIRKFEDQQWERVWLDRFKPMQFGSGLWIVPGDGQAPLSALHVLRLDPGLAFGTGTHPTTRLCLEWMDSHDFSNEPTDEPKGQLVVDYGCGSGVLGISAAIMGASAVICVDNDPQALTATRDNALRNNVEDVIETLMPEQFNPVQSRPGQLKPGHFKLHSAHVVLANILAGPLLELAPVLTASLRPGGALVLSGILEEQAQEVKNAYAAGFSDLQVTVLDGWVRLTGTKSG